jgi:PKD repeat protein
VRTRRVLAAVLAVPLLLTSLAASLAWADVAPVVTAPTSVNGAENSLTSFIVTATDPDGDPLADLQMSPTSTGATFSRNATMTSGTFSWTPTFSQSGVYTFTFTATNALSGAASTQITIQNTDRAPVVTAPGSVTGSEGSPLTFAVNASDPDGDPITSLTSSLLPSGATFSSNASHTSGTFDWTPAVGQAGNYTVSFTATNTLSGRAFVTIGITTAGGDRVPVVVAPATASGAENMLITFTVNASDPDGDAILSLTAGGPAITAGGTFTANASNTSGTFSWTPNFAQNGSYAVTFTASNALSGSATTSITVGGPDRAPVVNAPLTASTLPNVLLTFQVSAADPDGDAIFSLTAQLLPGGATFVSNASHTSGTFSWTPNLAQSGTFNVTFTATNALSGSATTAITVLSGGDRAPVVTAPTTFSGNQFTLITFTVSAADPDGEAIASLTAAPLPSGATFASNAAHTSGTFSWTPNLFQAGTYSVTFTASNALSGTATTSITVIHMDRPPVVTAPSAVTGTIGQLLTFTVTAADPDGGTITSLTASGSAITAGGTFTVNASNTSGTFTWTPAAAGSDSVTFTAVSGLSGSATTAITVTSGADRAPVVTAPATATFGENVPGSFTVSAADPDGDAIASLTASGTAITAGASFTSNTAHTSGTLSWTPTFSQAGTYSATFTASNALTGSATTSITVGQIFQPPVVTAPATVTGAEGTLITFTVSASDPDDAITILTASPLPPGATFSSNAAHTSGTFAWTPTFSQAGTYNVTFTAANSLSGSATTTITVQDVCQPAVADAGGPYTAVLNAPVSFDGSGSTGSSLTYLWDFGDGDTGSGVTVTHTYTTVGVFTVILSVQGSCGSPSTDVTTATVNQFCGLAFTTGGNKNLRLDSGKQTWCAQIEPTGGCYSNTDVDLASIVMQYSGGAVSEIHASSDKSSISGDKNQNGIDEITACFQKSDLRLLFSALPSGENTVTVTIRMNLVTGGQVAASLTIRVFSSGSALAASVTPNPFNPRATLSFRTMETGFARARLFDSSGRLVRTLLDERALAAGYHEVVLDGRGNAGNALASGIYLFRVETAEGTASGRVVLLK